jgi:Common central domain of tyrosinase/Polyphenol oxidase middle domain
MNDEILPRESIADFIKDPAKLDALKGAVDTMMKRPATDPTSWWYQANIHGAGNVAANRPDESDPLWNRCQHHHWWFLPWHRVYLYYLERMLQKAAGDDAFRLPYWDYSDPSGNQRALPPPFLDETSPLYVPNRLLRESTDELGPTTVDTTTALSRPQFVGSSIQGGFGGGREDEPIQFLPPGFRKSGSLELVPHNGIHVEVGGKMLHPWTAAQDPIFWLHHCNIDRLWEVWLESDERHTNPPDDTFLNASFTFIDESGQQVIREMGDFLDTTQLGYTYPRLPDREQARLLMTMVRRETMSDLSGPITATRLAEATPPRPVTVEANPVTIPLERIAAEPEARLLAAESATTPQDVRLALVLRGIEFDKLPTNTYEVYLDLPTADHTTSGQTRHYVGLLAFFEAAHGGAHGGHGAPQDQERTWAFDVTETLDVLRADPTYDPDRFTVSVVPVGPFRQGKPTRPEDPVEVRINGASIEAVQSASP